MHGSVAGDIVIGRFGIHDGQADARVNLAIFESEFGNAHMRLHVFNAVIKIRQHLRELLSTHKLARARSIEASGQGLEVVVVLEVLV